MSVVEVRVPDLGDSKGVKVVEVLVAKGAEIRLDDPLITLETEKASMDVPSPVAGVIESIDIKKGDDVVAGTRCGCAGRGATRHDFAAGRTCGGSCGSPALPSNAKWMWFAARPNSSDPIRWKCERPRARAA